MSTFTTTQLGQYMAKAFTGAETFQAQAAIDQAVGIASALLQYDIDPQNPSTNSVPSEFSGISAGSCGTIAAGKWFKYPIAGNGKRIITAPFTAIRSVIFAQRGYNYAGLTTCTAGITFVQPYQFDTSFNGNKNAPQRNLINIRVGLTANSSFNCDNGFGMVLSNDATIAFVDANFGWPNGTAPAALTGMVMAIAQDIIDGSMNNGGLKSESIEGHSYTFADGKDIDEKFEDLISLFGAGSYNIL